MDITIFKEGDEFIVATDLGLRIPCKDMDQAAVYANGLRDGYKAAIGKLGSCHVHHSGVR